MVDGALVLMHVVTIYKKNLEITWKEGKSWTCIVNGMHAEPYFMIKTSMTY